MIDGISKFHPYEKTMTGCPAFRGMEEIPRKVVTYLLDMPSKGYVPPDDNDYPRCRLAKYLFYDDAIPLQNKLPTPSEKLAILYDPERPDGATTEKGYRIFPQSYIGQSQTDAQTTLRIYMGRTIAKDTFSTELSIVFLIMSNVTYEPKAMGMARTFAMEQAILEALNGVNISGIGTFYFDRRQHPDCGSDAIGDRGTNVGRRLTMGLTWAAE